MSRALRFVHLDDELQYSLPIDELELRPVDPARDLVCLTEQQRERILRLEELALEVRRELEDQ